MADLLSDSTVGGKPIFENLHADMISRHSHIIPRIYVVPRLDLHCCHIAPSIHRHIVALPLGNTVLEGLSGGCGQASILISVGY